MQACVWVEFLCCQRTPQLRAAWLASARAPAVKPACQSQAAQAVKHTPGPSVPAAPRIIGSLVLPHGSFRSLPKSKEEESIWHNAPVPLYRIAPTLSLLHMLPTLPQSRTTCHVASPATPLQCLCTPAQHCPPPPSARAGRSSLHSLSSVVGAPHADVTAVLAGPGAVGVHHGQAVEAACGAVQSPGKLR